MRARPLSFIFIASGRYYTPLYSTDETVHLTGAQNKKRLGDITDVDCGTFNVVAP